MKENKEDELNLEICVSSARVHKQHFTSTPGGAVATFILPLLVVEAFFDGGLPFCCRIMLPSV